MSIVKIIEVLYKDQRICTVVTKTNSYAKRKQALMTALSHKPANADIMAVLQASDYQASKTRYNLTSDLKMSVITSELI